MSTFFQYKFKHTSDIVFDVDEESQELPTNYNSLKITTDSTLELFDHTSDSKDAVSCSTNDANH